MTGEEDETAQFRNDLELIVSGREIALPALTGNHLQLFGTIQTDIRLLQRRRMNVRGEDFYFQRRLAVLRLLVAKQCQRRSFLAASTAGHPETQSFRTCFRRQLGQQSLFQPMEGLFFTEETGGANE